MRVLRLYLMLYKGLHLSLSPNLSEADLHFHTFPLLPHLYVLNLPESGLFEPFHEYETLLESA